MVQLLTWEWLARDILFQLANDRCIGLPWRRSGRVMVYWMSRDTTTIWDWDWTAWESPRPVHCIHTSRAFVSTSGLKKEFKGKREIDPVFPCHPPPPPRNKALFDSHDDLNMYETHPKNWHLGNLHFFGVFVGRSRHCLCWDDGSWNLKNKNAKDFRQGTTHHHW